MPTPLAELAIDSALRSGNAILKFISPNDTGITGSHQAGFYLPKPAWRMFTNTPPERGTFAEHQVEIAWQNGLVTASRIKWYGEKTRSEYRLTRFGKGFPYLTADTVGDLLVLIPLSHEKFQAFVLDLDEDIDEVLAALGVQPFERWAVFQNGAPLVETEDECLRHRFAEFVRPLGAFPSGEVFSEATRRFVEQCVRNFARRSLDDALMTWMETEYRLFQTAERQLCQPDIARVFRDVDDFLQTAARILNRRKSRAGRSLENHVDHALNVAHIPHEMRPAIDGKPDIIIPSRAAYEDRNFPTEKLLLVGVKTTCKDRWRQVLNEGKRVAHKHILTMQPGISASQLDEMHRSNVTLIVPKRLHSDYPAERSMQILTVEQFVDHAREMVR